MRVIRYSRGFKIKLVREAEEEGNNPHQVGRKYGVKGSSVMRWARKFGSGKHGKVIRVEKADEINEAARVRRQLQLAKEALADAHMELSLEKAFLTVACEQLDQTVEGFKKKHGGRPRTRRSSLTRS